MEIRTPSSQELNSQLFTASTGTEVTNAIHAGANVNAKDSTGKTALHLAVFNKNMDVVKSLITAGADVNAKDNNGMTPLHIIGDLSLKFEYIKPLVNAGANINETDKDGNTPLILASQFGDFAYNTIKTLVEAGADVNLRNADGDTALHCAARQHSDKTTDMLIKAGAIASMQNNQGKTPLDVADVIQVKELLSKKMELENSFREGLGEKINDPQLEELLLVGTADLQKHVLEFDAGLADAMKLPKTEQRDAIKSVIDKQPEEVCRILLKKETREEIERKCGTYIAECAYNSAAAKILSSKFQCEVRDCTQIPMNAAPVRNAQAPRREGNSIA